MRALECQTPTLTPLPSGGYAETVKCFFTHLMSQAGIGHTSPFFSDQIHGIWYILLG